MRAFQLLAPLLFVGFDAVDAAGDLYLNASDRLSPGTRMFTTSLCTGEWLWLTFQTDGNLVLYTRTPMKNWKSFPVALWSSNTVAQNSADVDAAVMQTDGNFVIYEKGGMAKWDSGTYPNTDGESNFLTVHDDETLSVGSLSHPKKWTAGTSCIPTPAPPLLPVVPGCFAGMLEYLDHIIFPGVGGDEIFECQSACKFRHFMYAGIYRGDQCYCGDSLGLPLPDEDCSDRCWSSQEQCGGPEASTVFHVRGGEGEVFGASKTKQN